MKNFIIMLLFAMMSTSAFAQFEQVVQGAYSNGSQTATCMLKYVNGNIIAYAFDRSSMGYNWQPIRLAKVRETTSYMDSQWAQYYSHCTNIGNTIVYFNLSNTNRNSNSYSSNSNRNEYTTNKEKIVQGVYFHNGQQNVIMLRFVGINVMSYATTKSYNGYEWRTNSGPSSATPTTSLDGSVYYSYKYKVNVNGVTVYFNQ